MRKLEEIMMQRAKETKMKVWVDEYDVGAPNSGGYTDAKWRQDCETRSAEIKKKKYVITRGTTKAKSKQIGGDHYKNMGVEPWDVVDTWTLEEKIGAYRSGLLKYVMRMGTKDERLQEAKKALHYAEKLVETLEAENG